MISRVKQIAPFALILFLVGCSSLDRFLSAPTPAPVPEATSTPQPPPTPTASAVDRPRILRLWLPPQFDPNAGTLSARILKQRLLDFEGGHPEIQIDVRIKGGSDVLNALLTTSNAAPGAMPDVIALPYGDMQAAASLGLLHPLDGLTTLMQDPDWYSVARDLAHVQNTEFGLPFAADALVILNRPSIFLEPPAGWEAVLQSGGYMTFPASDPNAFFSLSLYLSTGGKLSDDKGVISLDEASLVQLFSFYRDVIEMEVAPPLVRDFQTDTQALQLFHDGDADLAVVWASSGIRTQSGQYLPLLGLEKGPYSLADGWVWVLAGTAVENQPAAVELASYLVESQFLSEWTRELGYLPTRPQALSEWHAMASQDALHETLQSAHPVPGRDVYSVIGPVLQKAVIRLFSGDQPEVVARSVIEELR